MNEQTKMRHLGAVTVVAEQTDDSGGDVITRSQPFLLHTCVSAALEIDDEEAISLASEIICASKWEMAIVSMLEGQRALLPSPKSGVYRAVRRFKDAAALAITDFKPGYDVDWSAGKTGFARPGPAMESLADKWKD
jgi:hypothetical protein